MLRLILVTCKKSGSKNIVSNNSFHLDETNNSGINRTIYFAQSATNLQQLVNVGSTAAGPGSYGMTGFNVMTIDKIAEIKTMHSYIL